MSTFRHNVSAALFAVVAILAPLARPQSVPAPSRAPILIELFTSEGCSSCPPADALLRQINAQKSSSGQLIIGLSEHVTYWNQLGWKDPFSADQFTSRQNEYNTRFNTEGPYTPQMIVNGREQFVGSDRAALRSALDHENTQPRTSLQILDAKRNGPTLTFTYSTQNLTGRPLLLMAALVDDTDHSSVERGENAGRSLDHVFVVRTLIQLGHPETGRNTINVNLSPEMQKDAIPHHLVVFLQQSGLGPIEGVDAKAF